MGFEPVTPKRSKQPPAARKQRPTVIIARGDDIRYFTIRPLVAAAVGTVLVAVTAGYLLSTAYWVLRDDFVGAAIARQARLQQEYEDRISALRTQLDRATSRQMLDQQLMQRKVGELIQRQDQLTERHSRLGLVLEREAGPQEPVAVPVPTPRPERRAGVEQGLRLDDTITGTAYAAASPVPSVPWPVQQTAAEAPATGADRLFGLIDRSLSEIEAEQMERVEMLAENAYAAAETIAGALASTGITIAEGYGEQNVGGPLIAADGDMPFEERVRELDEMLDWLEELKRTARRIPVANPVPGAAVTSTFGVRRDPILRRPAHHSGVDFKASVGSPVRSTGGGTVVSAGWNGGYGRMVEVDHGDGVTTRYAHLSKILVAEGQKVDLGTIIGRAGSSGRSTGPHLHYEVRRNGTAMNPLKFISAGRRIVDYL